MPSVNPSPAKPLKKSTTKHLRSGLILVACASIALSFLSFWWLKQEERQFIQTDFSRLAESRLSSLEQAVVQKLLKLRSLAVLHESLGGIPRNMFPTVIRRLGFDLDRIRTIGWIPRVDAKERVEFERRAQVELGRHFHFRQKSPQGGLQVASERPVYYPVYYQYPDTDDQTLGFDVSSAPFPMRTLNRALETGSLAFGIVPFDPSENQEISLLAVYPVYLNKMHEMQTSSPEKNLAGFYFILAPVRGIYQNVRDQLPPVGLDLYIFASFHSGTDSMQILFSPSRASTDETAAEQTQSSLREGLYLEKHFHLGSGMPDIIYILKPTQEFVQVRQTWRPWAALFGGLTFSGALALFIFLQIRHTGLTQHFALEQQRYATSLEKEVAERKLVEERLKTSNLELEAFVYTVSHDLKTPLSAIIGHAEILQIQNAEDLSKNALDSVRTIEEQGRRMSRLMEDLLTLSRVGRIPPPQEKVDSSAVLHSVIEGLGPMILEKNIFVKIGQIHPVLVPKSLLAQIFDNLISNAIRYGCVPGARIEIDSKVRDSSVIFCVRDYGHGIPREERDKVFEVFYRGSSGHSDLGTGIGLATVKKIARQYGGDVWYDETPGGGATFFVKIANKPNDSFT